MQRILLTPHRLFWLVAFAMVLVCVWQIGHLRQLVSQSGSAAPPPTVAERYERTQPALQTTTATIAQWEDAVLGSDESQFLSWLTVVADEYGVDIASTERLTPRRETAYRIQPLEVQAQGDYHRLGQFLNRVERAHPEIPIQALRMFTRKSSPEVPVLQLTFHFMHGDADQPLADGELTDSSPASVTVDWETAAAYPAVSDRGNPFALEAPTVLATAPDAALPSLPTLSAILWDESHPVALLESHGRTVNLQVGESLGPFFLKRIERYAVVLEARNEEQRIELWPVSQEIGTE